MPSKERLKQLGLLKTAKYRQKYGQFVVEGMKSVIELIHSEFEVLDVVVTSAFLSKHPSFQYPAEIVTEKEFDKIAQFDTPSGVLAVAKMKKEDAIAFDSAEKITLALDGIRDPGNLGTLLRTADWFGIKQVWLSEDCADVYNHKTLSATMGSFTRMHWKYAPLKEVVGQYQSYGFALGGTPLAEVAFKSPALIIIGSESHGISAEIKEKINDLVEIESYGEAESLNAAVAAGIAMEHAARQLLLRGKK